LMMIQILALILANKTLKLKAVHTWK